MAAIAVNFIAGVFVMIHDQAACPSYVQDSCTHQAAGMPRMPAQSHGDLKGLSDMVASKK